MGDEISVTVIATGFDRERVPLSSVVVDKVLERAFVGKYKNQVGVVRLLTPRECLRLMGFSDLFKIVIPDVHMYRQSGNSIVVDVFQCILKEIIKTGVFDEKD